MELEDWEVTGKAVGGLVLLIDSCPKESPAFRFKEITHEYLLGTGLDRPTKGSLREPCFGWR